MPQGTKKLSEQQLADLYKANPQVCPDNVLRPWMTDQLLEDAYGGMQTDFEKLLALTSPVKESYGTSDIDQYVGLEEPDSEEEEETPFRRCKAPSSLMKNKLADERMEKLRAKKAKQIMKQNKSFRPSLNVDSDILKMVDEINVQKMNLDSKEKELTSFDSDKNKVFQNVSIGLGVKPVTIAHGTAYDRKGLVQLKKEREFILKNKRESDQRAIVLSGPKPGKMSDKNHQAIAATKLGLLRPSVLDKADEKEKPLTVTGAKKGRVLKSNPTKIRKRRSIVNAATNNNNNESNSNTNTNGVSTISLRAPNKEATGDIIIQNNNLHQNKEKKASAITSQPKINKPIIKPLRLSSTLKNLDKVTSIHQPPIPATPSTGYKSTDRSSLMDLDTMRYNATTSRLKPMKKLPFDVKKRAAAVRANLLAYEKSVFPKISQREALQQAKAIGTEDRLWDLFSDPCIGKEEYLDILKSDYQKEYIWEELHEKTCDSAPILPEMCIMKNPIQIWAENALRCKIQLYVGGTAMKHK